MKTTKNKTNRELILPKTAYYTLKEVFAVNTHFNATITVRVRHTKAVINGEVVEIGAVTGGKGRPEKIYAKAPVTQSVIDKALKAGINLIDNADKLVNVMSVSTSAKPPATTTPATVIPSTNIASSIK